MIPQWMIDAYLLRSGDSRLVLNGKEQICNEHGFLTYEVEGSTFKMHHVFGNGAYWQAEMERIAKSLGCNKILCGTWRNPQPMCRKYGYKVVRMGSILEKEI